MTSSPHRLNSQLYWVLLVAIIVAITIFATTMISPVYTLVIPFWLMCVWAVFWVIRLAVRYGVNDALQANRHWMSAPDRHRIDS